ncbi:MAG: dienelactone hydrolase family protein [Bacteroidota bacterium]
MRLLFLFSLVLLATGCTDDNYGEAMSREHAGESPVATPIAAAIADDVITGRPVYASVGGESVTGFLARPDTNKTTEAEEPLPGLIVIQEWWGLNDNIQTMAKRFADEGYVALAVDLYGGEIAEDAGDARRLMSAAMEREAMLTDNLRQAYDYLVTQEGVGEVGVIGWCFGGAWSLRTALAMPDDIGATVIYYGRLITDRDRLAALDMPILGIFGAEDQGIPVESVREFETVLADLGKDAQIEVYEGAGHAFANPSGERYDAEAAEDAWARTLAFFDEHLRSGQRGE